MDMTSRLLGLAFAAADSLVEVKDGAVVFALGAAPSPRLAWDDVMSSPFLNLFHTDDHSLLEQTLAELQPGQRSGVLSARIRCGAVRTRQVSLRLFSLPELAPAISCALSYNNFEHTAPLDPETFIQEAEVALKPPFAGPVKLAFVDVPGLTEVAPDQQSAISEKIAALLTSISTDGVAARLTPERYALLQGESDSSELVDQVQGVGRSHGVDLAPNITQTPVGDDPLCALRAMRFAIEGCLKDGGLERPEQAFADALKRTLHDAARFRSAVRHRDFKLNYQPIVDLKTRQVHHFEALTRFEGVESPADAIRMAEELGLIENFDLAVAECATQRLRQGPGKPLISINVSGASLAHDAYVQALLDMTNDADDVRGRLFVEITETAALADMESANRRLSALRAAGIRVCIDDFGAGSATFDYVRGLSADAVKIDGSLVQGIETNHRARILIGHLVELCADLKMQTVAEMVETEAAAKSLTDLGVGFGQGWLFGRAEQDPRMPNALSGLARSAARRQNAA